MTSSADGDALTRPLHDRPPNHFQQAAYEWIRAPMPVIAAIHGHCLGGGLQIALGADIRIASPDANLSVLEVRWGLIPDMAITRTLPRLVRIDVAKELTFTGRAFSGTEAHALGLVTRLSDDPLDAARALANEIAVRSPDAVRRAKRLFQEGWSGSPEETMALEARLQLEIARRSKPAGGGGSRAGQAGQPSSSTLLRRDRPQHQNLGAAVLGFDRGGEQAAGGDLIHEACLVAVCSRAAVPRRLAESPRASSSAAYSATAAVRA